MRHFVSCLIVLAIPMIVQGAKSEDHLLADFFKAFLEEEMRLKPLDASRLGDHRFDHLLDDISDKARQGWNARYQRILDELPKKVNYKNLSRSAQIDYEI